LGIKILPVKSVASVSALMLQPSEYRAIAILNISHSLLHLSRDTTYRPRDIYKVLLQAHGVNHVSYFIDGIDFGPMSILKLKTTTEGLVRNKDYDIVERTEPVAGDAFVKKLLEKARSKQH
jgi:hypothetical protein